MTNVATDLVGKTVEVFSSSDGGRRLAIARGVIRAMTVYEDTICVLLEEGADGWVGVAGGMASYDIRYNPIRVVGQCSLCGAWKHPSELHDSRCKDHPKESA